VDVLKSEAFVSGDTFTDFIDMHFSDWQPGTRDASLVGLAYVIGQIAGKRHPRGLSGRY
jgi:hypothetical protein